MFRFLEAANIGRVAKWFARKGPLVTRISLDLRIVNPSAGRGGCSAWRVHFTPPNCTLSRDSKRQVYVMCACDGEFQVSTGRRDAQTAGKGYFWVPVRVFLKEISI